MKATIDKDRGARASVGVPSSHLKKQPKREDHTIIPTHCRICGARVKAPIGYLVMCGNCTIRLEPFPKEGV